jgi:hypothetical protein
LFQQGGEGPLGEAGGGGVGELLHGLKVGVQAGATVTEGTAGNDFAPTGGEVTDFLEEFGRKFATCHVRYRLVLAAGVREQHLSPLYDTRLGRAKRLMASRATTGTAAIPQDRSRSVDNCRTVVVLAWLAVGGAISHSLVGFSALLVLGV